MDAEDVARHEKLVADYNRALDGWIFATDAAEPAAWLAFQQAYAALPMGQAGKKSGVHREDRAKWQRDPGR